MKNLYFIIAGGVLLLISSGCNNGFQADSEDSNSVESHLLNEKLRLDHLLSKYADTPDPTVTTPPATTTGPTTTTSSSPTSDPSGCQIFSTTDSVDLTDFQGELQNLFQEIQSQDTSSLSSSWQTLQTDLTNAIQNLFSGLNTCLQNSNSTTSSISTAPNNGSPSSNPFSSISFPTGNTNGLPSGMNSLFDSFKGFP